MPEAAQDILFQLYLQRLPDNSEEMVVKSIGHITKQDTTYNLMVDEQCGGDEVRTFFQAAPRLTALVRCSRDTFEQMVSMRKTGGITVEMLTEAQIPANAFRLGSASKFRPIDREHFLVPTNDPLAIRVVNDAPLAYIIAGIFQLNVNSRFGGHPGAGLRAGCKTMSRWVA